MTLEEVRLQGVEDAVTGNGYYPDSTRTEAEALAYEAGFSLGETYLKLEEKKYEADCR